MSSLALLLNRRLNHRLDTDLKTHEATLRAHVDLSLLRTRGEIERDLKHHEVRLRVAAEFRLKMLERMLTDVADYRSKLGAAIGATSLLMHEVHPRGGRSDRARELLFAAQQSFAALSGAGPFMPTDLQGPTTEITNDFFSCLKDVVEWANLTSEDERHIRCVKTNATMAEVSGRSTKLFGSWQAQQFSQFTSQLEQLDTTAAPQLQR